MTHQIGSKVRAVVLACCTVMICSAPILAQDPGMPPPPQNGQGMGGRNPAEMEQRRLEMMTRQLNLSSDQATQVKAILDSQNQQMMALRDGASQGGDRRQQMMAIRQASSAKIRALLTDDQKTKFDAMEARMQNRQRGGGGNGNQDAPPPPPPSL